MGQSTTTRLRGQEIDGHSGLASLQAPSSEGGDIHFGKTANTVLFKTIQAASEVKSQLGRCGGLASRFPKVNANRWQCANVLRIRSALNFGRSDRLPHSVDLPTAILANSEPMDVLPLPSHTASQSIAEHHLGGDSPKCKIYIGHVHGNRVNDLRRNPEQVNQIRCEKLGHSQHHAAAATGGFIEGYRLVGGFRKPNKNGNGIALEQHKLLLAWRGGNKDGEEVLRRKFSKSSQWSEV